MIFVSVWRAVSAENARHHLKIERGSDKLEGSA
jgi:hypothetical protein